MESIIVLIYKKGDNTDCITYRDISILPNTYTSLSNILLSKLTPYAEEIIGDHQCGFKRNRSSTDHILCIRQMFEKKGNTTNQYIRSLYTLRVLMIHFGGRTCIIFSLSLVSL